MQDRELTGQLPQKSKLARPRARDQPFHGPTAAAGRAGHFPQLDGPVLTGRHQPAAVRAEADITDAAVMAAEGVDGQTVGGLEQLDRGVLTGGSEKLTAG